jgi:hypothetical protein
MESAEESHDRPADHHVVHMGYHEIGIVKVDVRGKGAQKEARETADREQEDKRKGVQHRRMQMYRPLIEGSRPVKYLDSRRDGDKESKE